MRKTVTIRDIARRVGTSSATVSYALNDRTDMVSDRMQRRIQRAAREMGYRPSRQARQLRAQANQVVAMQLDSGAVASNSWRPTFLLTMRIQQGASAYLAARGYRVQLLIGQPGGDAAALEAQVLRENAVDGVILTGNRDVTQDDVFAMARRIKETGLPAVTMSEQMGKAEIPLVSVNLQPAVLEAVQRLKALKCRSVTYVGMLHRAIHERMARFEMFRSALEAADIELIGTMGTIHEAEAYQHTLDLLEQSRRPDCIIYGADHLAMAGLQALAHRGLAAPRDVRVLGVDHAPYAADAPVQLASLDQRFFDRGRTLAKVLLDQIERPEQAVPARTVLDAYFVDGESLSGGSNDLFDAADSQRSFS